MKYLKFITFFIVLATVNIISLSTSASASSSSSDTALTGFFAIYLLVIILFYCLMCLSILATFLHAILAYICVLDINKRSNTSINKEMWLALIIIPGTLPYLSMLGGAFISVGAELYYLLKIKPELD